VVEQRCHLRRFSDRRIVAPLSPAPAAVDPSASADEGSADGVLPPAREAARLPSSPREQSTNALFALAERCVTAAERQGYWDQVVLRNTGVAEAISARYRVRGIDPDDLRQVAYLGLVKAVRGYRVGHGPGFLAYAVPTISGEIKRHFRDNGWAVRPPRRVQELRSALVSTEARLVQQLGRVPRAAELAEALGVGIADLREAQSADSCFAALSLDAPCGLDRLHGWGELIPDDDDAYAVVDVLATLRPALALLNHRDREILVLRFARGCTQDEIGRALGIGQMQVSRLLAAILVRLAAALAPPGAASAGADPRHTALDWRHAS